MRFLAVILLLFSNNPFLNAQTAEDFYRKAETKVTLQDFNGAFEDLNQAINIDPRFIKAFNFRGYVKDELDDYNGALQDYNIAIALKDDYGDAYANRGKAKRKLNDYNGAITDYTTAIALNPSGKKPTWAEG